MSFPSPLVLEILALLPPKPAFGQAVLYILLGFTIVMVVLTLMWAGTWLSGLIFKSIDKREVAKATSEEEGRRTVAAAAAAIAVSQQIKEDPDRDEYGRLVAVIAAAAQVALGRPARVVSIKHSSGEWSAEGRRQIFDSRRVR